MRGRHLAGASLVVLQALQDALGQKFDVSVRLRVRVNQLQLLQAALLQEHAAVAGGCEEPEAVGGKKVYILKLIQEMVLFGSLHKRNPSTDHSLKNPITSLITLSPK